MGNAPQPTREISNAKELSTMAQHTSLVSPISMELIIPQLGPNSLNHQVHPSNYRMPTWDLDAQTITWRTSMLEFPWKCAFFIIHQSGAIQKWSPIIPNSQLIMNPVGDNPSDWQLSIFIEPTHAILVVVIVTIIVLVLLGGVIIWKHIKEKEEDKKTQETFFQMFRW